MCLVFGGLVSGVRSLGRFQRRFQGSGARGLVRLPWVVTRRRRPEHELCSAQYRDGSQGLLPLQAVRGSAAHILKNKRLKSRMGDEVWCGHVGCALAAGRGGARGGRQPAGLRGRPGHAHAPARCGGSWTGRAAPPLSLDGERLRTGERLWGGRSRGCARRAALAPPVEWMMRAGPLRTRAAGPCTARARQDRRRAQAPAPAGRGPRRPRRRAPPRRRRADLVVAGAAHPLAARRGRG